MSISMEYIMQAVILRLFNECEFMGFYLKVCVKNVGMNYVRIVLQVHGYATLYDAARS